MRVLAAISLIVFGMVSVVYKSESTVPVTSNEIIEARPSTDPSVLALYCKYDESRYYQSRVSLFQTRGETQSYGLTTAHGLVDQKDTLLTDCFVQDFKGVTYPIDNIFIPDAFEAGTSSDWAVISISVNPSETIIRYRLPEFSEGQEQEMRRSANVIAFPSARGLGYNGQTCLSLPAAYAGLSDENILAHDCRAIGGQSGSPVSVSYNGNDVLLGFHLGKSFILKSPVTKRPEHLGFFRFLDRQIVLDIDEAVRSLQK